MDPPSPGTATLEPGSENPVDSPPGTATLEPGSENPVDSPPGTATLEPGSENPVDSPPGTARLQPGSENPARLEPGGPSGPRGWHSRGYIPHFDSPDAIQHVTFHLADSMPVAVVRKMEQEILALPKDRQDARRRERIEAWIDAGHGCCLLRQPAVATLVQESLLFFDGQRYRLFAWVVMPNHVHVLFQPIAGWTMAKAVASWKTYTGRRLAPLLLPAATATGHQVWHREYWDRFIRNERHFQVARDYIHHNPVKAGLVQRPEDWRWSSASWDTVGARLEPGGPS